MRKRRAVLVGALFVTATALSARAGPVGINPIGGDGFNRWGRSDVQGFDACTAPTRTVMDAWWGASPFFDVGIYIGGANRSCAQPNLTPGWASLVHHETDPAYHYWDFYLIWVGPQAPTGCATRSYTVHMSATPSTAAAQGAAEADAAVAAAGSLGFSGYNIYYYDLEPWDTNSSGCRAAVKAFIEGWTSHIYALGEKSGVYGSSCASGMGEFSTIDHVPNSAWLADWNGDPDVWGLKCIDNTLWNGGRRLHQWRGGHKETWGVYTINIDSDCAYGLVTPHGHGFGDGACLYE